MVNATSTVPAIMSGIGDTVGGFGGLITLVVGLSLGFFVVSWIISRTKSAKRG